MLRSIFSSIHPIYHDAEQYQPSYVEKCQQDQSFQCHSYNSHITPSCSSFFFYKDSTGVLPNYYEAYGVRGYDISDMNEGWIDERDSCAVAEDRMLVGCRVLVGSVRC